LLHSPPVHDESGSVVLNVSILLAPKMESYLAALLTGEKLGTYSF
jgi:hypothetical protein